MSTVAIAARFMNGIILLVMKRAVIAVSWIAVMTLPVVLAPMMKFGCCRLPAMPFCHMASASHHEAQTRVPPPPAKRFVTPSLIALHVSNETRSYPSPARTTFRSFITLGATRCDRDVGLNVLLVIFLI